MASTRFAMFASLVLVLVVSGCAPEPESAIVTRAEAAGAGKLAGVPADAIRDWLSKNRAVAREIDSLCAPVREKASAEWAQTTEGKLCGAARSQAFFNSGPARGDGKAYAPGTK